MRKPGDKAIKVSLAALILVVLFIVVANILGNTASYYSTVKKMVGCMTNNEVDKLETCASSISIAMMGGEEKAHETMRAEFETAMDKMNADVGRVTGISYTVTNENELSSDKVSAIKTNLESQYDMDTSGIKRILNVGLKIKVKGETASKDYNLNLYLIRETGGWKLYRGYF